ncbi:carboxypeptidase-like regulatory domain-containing protein [Bacteroidota bacterium]
MITETLKKYTFTFLLSLLIIPLFAQQSDSLYYFSGQVVSKDGKYPVALAHIINIDQHWGAVADTLGYFNIWVKSEDTLNISAIGFDYLSFGVNGTTNDSVVRIEIQNRYYEIPEATISYLGTYKDFEYKVLNLKLPESGINPEFEKLFKVIDPPPLFVEPEITSPASLIYVLFSKDAKEKIKYAELDEEGKVNNEVLKRYNEHIIRNLTGLSGEEAYKFMRFCNFQDKYILSIDDYNLYSEILLRFESYKKSKEDSLLIE